ncbi:MAG: nitrogen fixation protein [Gammaproteobacteria bacterium]|nr:nitrogen fixation protein [Gammaproteobacteria bacterium]
MKIGVTSQNFRTITGHAGKTRRFLIYSENEKNTWIESERLDLPKDMSMHEFKGTQHPIEAVDVLITAGCGQGFINKMNLSGVTVLTTSETDPLSAIKLYIANGHLPPALPHKH